MCVDMVWYNNTSKIKSSPFVSCFQWSLIYPECNFISLHVQINKYKNYVDSIKTLTSLNWRKKKKKDSDHSLEEGDGPGCWHNCPYVSSLPRQRQADFLLIDGDETGGTITRVPVAERARLTGHVVEPILVEMTAKKQCLHHYWVCA